MSPASHAHDAGLAEIVVPGVEPWRRGKVRSVYALDGTLLLVASDRLSAYDSILPTPIPDKGRVLTALSAHWFRTLAAAAPHHLISTDTSALPEPYRSTSSLAGRSMHCRRARRVDVECVVRGYLTGSGLREVRTHGTLHGEPMPRDTPDGARLDPPRFTPTTKAEEGHDAPLTRGELADRVGAELARALEERSLAIYEEARLLAWDAGLVLADTKFEFGYVDDTLTLMKHKIGPGVAIKREYGPDVPEVEAFPAELNQVWTNLIANAIDAVDGDGTIRIRTRAETEFVVVEIIDDGPGMPPDVQARAFEPFFTTKDVGKGTGLGLDISRRIIAERHHGQIIITSEPGNTVVSVRVPRASTT